MKTSMIRNAIAASCFSLAFFSPAFANDEYKHKDAEHSKHKDHSENVANKKTAGEVVDDAMITTKLKAKFIEDDMVKALDIQVETFKGVVQLSGFANSQDEINRAIEIANTTKGVVEVKNDIRLKAMR